MRLNSLTLGSFISTYVVEFFTFPLFKEHWTQIVELIVSAVSQTGTGQIKRPLEIKSNTVKMGRRRSVHIGHSLIDFWCEHIGEKILGKF